MGDWGNQQAAVALEGDESPVEEVIDGRREEQSVLSIETLIVRRIAPGFAVAGPQVRWKFDSRHSAAPFDLCDSLSKESLSSARLDQRDASGLVYALVGPDLIFEVPFPDLHLFALGRGPGPLIGHNVHRVRCDMGKFRANEAGQDCGHRIWNFGEVDRLIASPRGPERRILARKHGSQGTRVVERTNLLHQRSEPNLDTPANLVPVSTSTSELDGLGCLVTESLHNANGSDQSVAVAEYDIAGSGDAHVLIELVIASVRSPLGRPKVTARCLLAERLILVNPPVAHAPLG